MIAGRSVGLAYLSLGAPEPVEHVEAAAAAGFDTVGLRVIAPPGLVLPHGIVGNAARQRAIREACARTGVRVFDLEVFPVAERTAVADLLPALDAAVAVDAAVVQVVVEDAVRPRALERFATLCDEAASRRLRVALEFMRWRAVRSIADARDFLAAACRPNAGLCVDCLHLARSGGSPADVAAVPAGQLHYVQLCDAPRASPPDDGLLAEARGGRAHPGAGELWLHALLDAVPPDVPLSVEVPRRVDEGLSARVRAMQAAMALRTFFDARSPGAA